VIVAGFQILLESPEKVPVPPIMAGWINAFNGADGMVVVSYPIPHFPDILIAGPLSTLLFNYGPTRPKQVRYGSLVANILWHSSGHFLDRGFCQDGSWFYRWRLANRSSISFPLEAQVWCDTESQMFALYFVKPGIFKISAEAQDHPGFLSRLVRAISDLGLDILQSQTSHTNGAKTIQARLLCGACNTITRQEIESALAKVQFPMETRISVEGEPLDDEYLALQSQLRKERSVFISYSHQDRVFVYRLFDILSGAGIKCWFDEHAMVPGDKLHDAIRRGVDEHDRFILVCSRSSLTSWWVDNELEEAFAKERKLGTVILIPIDIDGAVFDVSLNNPKCTQIRSRYVGDFRGWNDEEVFGRAVNKLLRALRETDL
jgi:hypothetical protein